jgi:membrane protease YdiL (CAAX protease family)
VTRANAGRRPLFLSASQETPDRDEPVTPDNDPYWALGFGLLYLTAIWFQPWIIQGMIGSSPITVDRVRAEGGLLILAVSAIRLVGLALVLLLILLRPRGQLRAALRPERPTWLAGAACATVFVALLLDISDIWPFPWRSQFSQTADFFRSYRATNQLATYLLSLSLSGFASPLIEEVIFRFGVLQSVLRWTRSRIVAVVVSSVLFGAMHLGYPIWRPDPGSIRSAIALTVFAAVLAILTLERRGRITGAIAIHVTYNVLSTTMFLWTAASP